MRSREVIGTALCTVCAALALTLCASAHDSYVYETAARPYHVLPFAFVLSVAAEYLALAYIAHAEKPVKTFWVVLVGNALAFGAAGAYYFISNSNEPPGMVYPPYITGVIFAGVSLLAEVWAASEILVQDTPRVQTRVNWTLLISNAFTAGAYALSERLICPVR